MIFINPVSSSAPLFSLLAVATIYISWSGTLNFLKRLWNAFMYLLQVGNMLIAFIRGVASTTSIFHQQREGEMGRAREDMTRLLVRLARCSEKLIPPLEALRQASLSAAMQAAEADQAAQSQPATAEAPPDSSSSSSHPTPEHTAADEGRQQAQASPASAQQSAAQGAPRIQIDLAAVLLICVATQHLIAAWMAYGAGDTDASRESSCKGMSVLDPLIGCGSGQEEPAAAPQK